MVSDQEMTMAFRLRMAQVSPRKVAMVSSAWPRQPQVSAANPGVGYCNSRFPIFLGVSIMILESLGVYNVSMHPG